MVTGGFFAHESADGTPFSQRVRRYYGPQGYRIWSVGENLLWSSPGIGPARAVQLWLASPGHRENLLASRLARDRPLRRSLELRTGHVQRRRRDRPDRRLRRPALAAAEARDTLPFVRP